MRFGLGIVFVRSPDPVNTLCRVGVWAIPPYRLALAFALSLARAKIDNFMLALAVPEINLAFARIVSFVLDLAVFETIVFIFAFSLVTVFTFAFAYVQTGVELCDVGSPAVPFWNLDMRHDEYM